MSTRTLSAYFDDVRKGRKDVAQVRQFLLDVHDRDPVKRGHLLHWLDQAQYEHPIPVTDFLILRKEVEAAVKNSPNRPADDATVIASVAPDAPTLVATAMTSASTQATEATLMGEEATRIDHSRDVTPLPERSDHAGLHNAATTMRPPPADTLILTSTPALSAGSSHLVSRRFLLWTAFVLATVAILGMLALWAWLGAQALPEGNARVAVSEVNQVLDQAPAGSIGTDEENSGRDVMDSPAQEQPMAGSDVDLTTLTEAELQQELQRRLAAEQLLPVQGDSSVHAVLRALAMRFPANQYLQERIAIKNAHLKLSDRAREQGNWEQAQLHLDAAFEVLQQASN